MKLHQIALTTCAALIFVGCESLSNDSEQLAAQGEASEVRYVDWNKRPAELWQRDVETTMLLVLPNKEQLTVYGIDPSRRTLEFALLIPAADFDEAKRVLDSLIVESGRGGFDYGRFGLPFKKIGPVGPNPSGGDGVPQVVGELAVKAGLLMQDTMIQFGDEAAFGDDEF